MLGHHSMAPLTTNDIKLLIFTHNLFRALWRAFPTTQQMGLLIWSLANYMQNKSISVLVGVMGVKIGLKMIKACKFACMLVTPLATIIGVEPLKFVPSIATVARQYIFHSNYWFLLLSDKCHRLFMLFIEISFTVYAWDIILDHLLHYNVKQRLLGNNFLWISPIIQKITFFWI